MALILQIVAGLVLGYLAIRWIQSRSSVGVSIASVAEQSGESEKSAERQIHERLQWSLSDLRWRFHDVLRQRLAIRALQVAEGMRDRADVVREESEDYSTECDNLREVVLSELEPLAQRVTDGWGSPAQVRKRLEELCGSAVSQGIQEIKEVGLGIIATQFAPSDDSAPAG